MYNNDVQHARKPTSTTTTGDSQSPETAPVTSSRQRKPAQKRTPGSKGNIAGVSFARVATRGVAEHRSRECLHNSPQEAARVWLVSRLGLVVKALGWSAEGPRFCEPAWPGG